MSQEVHHSEPEPAIYAAMLVGLDQRYREADEAAGTATAPEARHAARRRRLACRRAFDALRAEMAQRGLTLAPDAPVV